jgi:hypothetical protein
MPSGNPLPEGTNYIAAYFSSFFEDAQKVLFRRLRDSHIETVTWPDHQ